MYTAEIVRRQQIEARVRLSNQAKALLPFYEEIGRLWHEALDRALGQQVRKP